jgi:uncharacterized protein YdaU (DUF1376 family)
MADFPAIPLFTDAYLADTMHLSLEEHGAYLKLLMFTWRSQECALPDDDKRLAVMLGVPLKKWRALREVIVAPGMFRVEGGLLVQKRLTKEREFVARQSESQRKNAEARWRGKSLKNNDTNDADASERHMPNACQTDAPTPTPTPTPTLKKKERTEAGASVPKKARRKPELPLPENWVPSERNIADAEARNFQPDRIEHEADKFRNYHLAKGNLYRDWDAAWRTWLGNASRAGGSGFRNGETQGDRQLRLIALAARMG